MFVVWERNKFNKIFETVGIEKNNLFWKLIA